MVVWSEPGPFSSAQPTMNGPFQTTSNQMCKLEGTVHYRSQQSILLPANQHGSNLNAGVIAALVFDDVKAPFDRVDSESSDS